MMAAPPASSAPIPPVYLVTEEPGTADVSAGPGGVTPTLALGSVAIVVVLVAAAIMYHRRRLTARMDPADLALRTLSRRLRLRRADCAALRELAAIGIDGWPTPLHPVALLVSRHAFEAAAAVAHLCCADAATSRIDRIRWRAFGDTAPRSQAGRDPLPG